MLSQSDNLYGAEAARISGSLVQSRQSLNDLKLDRSREEFCASRKLKSIRDKGLILVLEVRRWMRIRYTDRTCFSLILVENVYSQRLLQHSRSCCCCCSTPISFCFLVAHSRLFARFLVLVARPWRIHHRRFCVWSVG